MRKNEFRCGTCKRLLAIGTGNLEIKCPRCGAMNHLRATSTDPNGETVTKERKYEKGIPTTITESPR